MPKLPKARKVSWKAPSKPFSKKGKKYKVSENHSFYNSKSWRELRKMFISEFPLCAWCEEEGIVKGADIVDHIHEIKNGGEMLDPSNLMSMCLPHHNQKTIWTRNKRKRNEI
tara:strand:+ start:58 stop:393 length:336 start_codon:yes stop_codon:yes gene_type:complete